MALINREENGVQTFLYQSAIRTLARKLIDGRCLLFLGAGASLEDRPKKPAVSAPPGGPPAGWAPLAAPVARVDATPSPAGLPTGRELAAGLVKRCGLKGTMSLPEAAAMYEFLNGRDELNQFLVDVIGNKSISPSRSVNQLIDIVAACKEVATLAITTNYDQQFERACDKKLDRPLKVIVYKGSADPLGSNGLHTYLPPKEFDDGPYWQPKKGCSLYKIHGCISQPGGRDLVITQEDYVNFVCNAFKGTSENDRAILNAVRGRLEWSTILYLGYSLSDYNFQALYKVTAERRNVKPKSYAVQFRDPDQPRTDANVTYWQQLVSYWEKRDTDIINARASEFTWDLLAGVNRAQNAAEGAVA
jgi:hypothetical protein